MAELYGTSHLQQDFFMRILDFKRVAKRLAKELPQKHPESFRLMQVYIWGINDGLREISRRGHSRNPYIMQEIGSYKIPEWRLQDSLTIALLQSFYQTRKSFIDDVTQARIRLQLGDKRYQEIYGSERGLRPFDFPILRPGEHPLVSKAQQPTPQLVPSPHTTHPPQTPQTQPTPQGDKSSRSKEISDTESFTKLGRLQQLESLLEPWSAVSGEGSNNWVVAATRSQSGLAMLANDPHLSITTPPFWHEIHIQAPGLDVMGLTLPGTPGVLVGHNQSLAWGLTNGYSNTADLLRVRPDKSGKIDVGGETHKIESFRPVVRVKIGTIYLPIFWKSFERTAIGPILPIEWLPNERLLLRWTGYHLTSSPIPEAIALMQARDVVQADQVLRKWQLPCWNYVFADKWGNIGYRQVGLVARRTSGHHGLIPANDTQQQWQGFLSAEEMPAVLKPQRGFVATANNTAFPDNYPLFLGHAYSPGHRARRIEQMIEQKPKLSFEDMMTIQTDVRVPVADILLDDMLRGLQPNLQLVTSQGRRAFDYLKQWDRRAEVQQVAPTIFRLWVVLLEQAMFAQDSERVAVGLKKPRAILPGADAMLRVLQGKLQPGSSLSVPQILFQTYQKTIAQLTKQLGSDPSQWLWHRYNLIEFRHLLDTALHRPPAQGKDGEQDTVNVAKSSGDGPFSVVNAASYRLIVELGPKIRSLGILPGHNIDHNPAQLGTQHKLWLQNSYRPRPFYPDEIQQHQSEAFIISW
jgi:penicillin amidase